MSWKTAIIYYNPKEAKFTKQIMRLKILLINPWIYDFAAYNLWSRPLGLIKVGEYLRCFDIDLFL
ncbi:MAG TPA: hypothetical protein DCP92_15830 [Nitrospiraceae bacterium]|nr:hypothetical protein [Nitrospiraceae bacterium]